MPTFEIQPHIGIGPVKLGMTRSQVRDAISTYADNGLDQASHPTLDYAFGNSLQVEYDDEGYVRFIGVGFYSGCGCDYMFQGQHIGVYSAAELFQVLAELDGDANHKFSDSEYLFPKIMINVWDADSQYAYLGGESRPVYGQVGIAGQGHRKNRSS